MDFVSGVDINVLRRVSSGVRFGSVYSQADDAKEETSGAGTPDNYWLEASQPASDISIEDAAEASGRQSEWQPSAEASQLPEAPAPRQTEGEARGTLQHILGQIDTMTSWPMQRQNPQASQLSEPARISSVSSLPHWASPHDAAQTSSPQSTFSGWTNFPGEVAPIRWFGLLADDAANDHNDYDFSFNLPEESNGVLQRTDPQAGLTFPSFGTSSFSAANLANNGDASSLRSPQAVASTPLPPNTTSVLDDQSLWQAPIRLQDPEIPMFRRFVTHIAHSLDLFDPFQHFSTFVPHLALQNEGLMKAILALSARHLSIKPPSPAIPLLDRTVAVQYYYETLQYLQSALQHPSYTRSLEIIATALIVSTYEMVDGGNGWERHLKGVFWIQRSQDNHGESGGLKQAVWWAWLRQDVWAAFRERRSCFSFFKPKRDLRGMDQFELARRSIYLLSQTVNFSSENEVKTGERRLQARIERADELLGMLEDWRQSLSTHFEPLPVEAEEEGAVFSPIWINSPALGAAIQMYSFARILLLIYRPAASGFQEFAARSKHLDEAVNTICGIAKAQLLINRSATAPSLTTSPDSVPNPGSVATSSTPSQPRTDSGDLECDSGTAAGASITSTQCLYAAGMYTHDATRREAIVELLGAHQAKTGWPINCLKEELRREWAKDAESEAKSSPQLHVG
ncbi:hypothetical protein H2199_007319 [Coniosporium tulheliwenetii]|uniref:Uncharacterized protein n=1 Tax=Coniosporium tulheliwenetii TaxID=3383036 RepID=A0ACC2YRB7_9PEZI|nr:hypothetical protein H2199_007319 [Cladosporium sp. JES 115]